MRPAPASLAEENFEEGGLAGAVVAEQGNALAARDLQLHIGKQRPSVIRLAEPLTDRTSSPKKSRLGEFRPHGLVLRGPVGLFSMRSIRCWMDMARR